MSQDIQGMHRKIDTVYFALQNFIEFNGKQDEFTAWLKKMHKKYEKEKNERAEPNKASAKADSN